MVIVSTKRAVWMLVGLTLAFTMLGGAASGQRKNHHPPKKQEREQVEVLEQQWSNAMLSGDVPSMDKLLSDDFLGVTAAGDLVTKAQQLDRMRTRALTVIKIDTKESKIKLIGHIAIVTSMAQMDSKIDGQLVSGAFRYTKVYQRLPNGSWRITSFEATRVRPGEKLRAVAEPGQG